MLPLLILSLIGSSYSLVPRAAPINAATYTDANSQTVTYQNCYSDAFSIRVLNGGPATAISVMTPQNCAFQCSLSNYPVSGVEYGSECYCGYNLPSAAPLSASACNMPCSGDATYLCGGSGTISIYQQTLLSNQQNYNATDPKVSYVGCGTIPSSLQSTSVIGPSSTSMTIDTCATWALANGYKSFSINLNDCFGYPGVGTIATAQTTCKLTCGGNSLKFCGSSTAGTIQLYTIATTNLPTTTVAQTTAAGQVFNYVNCYIDNMSSRNLPFGIPMTAVTPLICVTACGNLGYNMAGVEYGVECWCGNGLASTGISASCIMACAGDPTQSCGGSNALQVYQAQTMTRGFTATTPNSRGEAVSYVGCYVDNASSPSTRIFPLRLFDVAPVTPSICVNACAAKFVLANNLRPVLYAFAGLQYGSECWCSPTAPTAASVNQIQCTQMRCAGDTNSYCGGGNRMAVYRSTQPSTPVPLVSLPVPGFGTATYVGCYSTNPAKTPSQYTAITSGFAYLTIELCITACSRSGFAYAGLQGAASSTAACMCSQSIDTSGGTVSCSLACPGAPGELCGDYTNSVSSTSVYQTNANALTVAGGSGATFTTSLTTASTYIGCYVDSVTTRVLSTRVSLGSTPNSPSVCLDKCVALGFSLAGVEFGSECWCGNSLPAPWTGSPSNSAAAWWGECNMPCPGATTQSCGAGNRIAIYSKGGIVTAPTIQDPISDPALTVNGVTTTYAYQGCFPDYFPVSRTIRNAMTISSGVTPTNCAVACFNANYKYAAVEFGVECYCSNEIAMNPSGSLPTAITSAPSPCNMACKANTAYICGGSNYLSLYMTSGSARIPTTLSTTASDGTALTWTYGMCYREPAGGRAMSTQLNNPSNTPLGCMQAASSNSTLTVCALEYGGECWCNAGLPTRGSQIAEGYCGSYTSSTGAVVVSGMQCNGNSLQYCGAGNVLAVYTNFVPNPAITQNTTSPT